MRYIKLKNTEIEVSVLALGSWAFAGDDFWGDQDEAASIATVNAALDLGINFIDTAIGYGDGASERVVGKALKYQRERAAIATKVDGRNLSPLNLMAECERSLAHLQTDYIDLYQVHWPNPDIPLEDTVATLVRLQEQGKIRTFGVCNFGPQDLTRLLELTTLSTNQIPYSLLWRAVEFEIKPLCQQHDVGLLCYSPLAQGLLSGRYASIDDVPDYLMRTRWYSGTRPTTYHDESGCENEVFATLAQLRAVAADYQVPLATLSIAWLLHQAGVTSVVVGARQPEEVGRNIPAVDLALTPELIIRLADITAPLKEKLGANADMWVSPSRIR